MSSNLMRRLRRLLTRWSAAVALPESWWSEIPPELFTRPIPPQSPRELNNAVTPTVEAVRDELLRREGRIVGNMHRTEGGFNRRLRQRWGRAFDAFALVVIVASEAGEEAHRRHAESRLAGPRLDALRDLHAMACATAHEVLSLISNGYGRGATARSRTLHELAVTAWVLQGASAEIAQRYLDHEIVSTLKDAIQFQKSAERINYDPLPESQIEALRNRHDAMVKKWGVEFAKDNGWAAPLTGNRRAPKFVDLELMAGIDHLRPYYNYALHAIHAGSRGAALARYRRFGQEYILVGPANSGFAETAHGSLISLVQVSTCLLLQREDSFMALVLARVLTELSDRAGDQLQAVELQIQQDEDRIQAETRST